MSVYRQSPSKSPYKSIVKSIIDDRQMVEDQLHFKRGIAIEADNRRLLDQVSILRLKLRKMDELEIKHEALLKQMTLLSQTNDQVMIQLNQRRLENDRFRVAQVQNQERDLYKTAQLAEHNKGLEIENSDLKRDRNQSARIYQGHIAKLEVLLEEKLKELDILGMRFDKLASQKETGDIRFDEERARLKSEMTRAEYQREREIEQDKERRYSQKLLEIESMKRNHMSQIQLLEDEVNKLSRLNELKNAELETQIVHNRQLKVAQQADTRELVQQNESLRARMSKLQEHNRSEIQNIETKYSNMQAQGTISLKEQHGNEVRLLLSELDKLKWLLGEKNIEIQQLTQEKRDLKQAGEDHQLQLASEINLLKSKIIAQQDKYTEDRHNQTFKISSLEDKMLRESEGYHQKTRNFTTKIEQLLGDIKKKDLAYDRIRKETDIEKQKLLKDREVTRQELATLRTQFHDNKGQLQEERQKSENYRKKTQQEYQKLARQISELQQDNETLRDQLVSLKEESDNQLAAKIQQNESLRRTNDKLEKQYQEFQAKSTSEMGELSGAHRDQVQRIEGILAEKISQITKSFRQQKQSLQRQLSKAKKYAKDKQQQLRNVLDKFQELNAHFDNRERLVQFVPKSNSSILEAFNQHRRQSEFRVFQT